MTLIKPTFQRGFIGLVIADRWLWGILPFAPLQRDTDNIDEDELIWFTADGLFSVLHAVKDGEDPDDVYMMLHANGPGGPGE